MRNKVITVSLLSASLLISVLLLISARVSANDVVDRIAISVPVSCTMSGVINSGEDHNAEIQNGIYRDDIGKTTITIFCNDDEGFSVYAVGYTGGKYGNTALTNSNLGLSHNIVTGTATSGETSNWAMKLSTDPTATYPVTISNGFGSYSAVPSVYTKVVASASSTDIGVHGASFDTTYSAYIDSTQPAGAYIGQVKYTMVHPSVEVPIQSYDTEPGYIAYYPNTNTAVGAMNMQPVLSTDTSATLLASNFSREGYGFAGWNTAHDYNGDYYGPNEVINFEAGQYTDGNKGLSLYAVWIKTNGDMQNWTGCSSLMQGETVALTDQRNHQTYSVAKLADDQCWMIENMQIDNSVDSQTMLVGSAAIGDGFDVLPPSNDNWNTYDATLIQFNNNFTNSRSFGSYYSWSATVASTLNYSSEETINTSICPSGWRLPVGGAIRSDSNNDYYNLMKSIVDEEPNVNTGTAYGYYNGTGFSNSIRKYPNNFIYSGYWYGNSSVVGSGYYWTATTYSSNSAYSFYFDETIVRPGNTYEEKYRGQTFRCIATD